MSGIGKLDWSYRPDLDGMRALAIVSVVLYHAGTPLLTGGFTGVDIFFVLSGYLIGGHIYSELQAGNFSFLEFYRRRAKRILPALYAVVGFSMLGAFFLLSPAEMSTFGESAFAATLSVSNLIFWHFSNYFSANSNFFPLLNTWSLGVEEQFYLVIPLLMVWLARKRRKLLLPAIAWICLLSFFLAWFELGYYPENVFYFLPERAWELGAGVTLAVAELQGKRVALGKPILELASGAGLLVMLAPLFLLRPHASFPGPAALPSVAGALLLIASPASWINRRVLSHPLLVFVGRISYSWYLWHWPILAFLRIVTAGELSQAATFAAITASLAIAICSYHLIEQPFRRSERKAGPLLIRYALASLLILAASAGLWLSKGLPQRFPALGKFEDAAQVDASTQCLAKRDHPKLFLPCLDASDLRPSVALWGDSHSAALAPGLRPIAQAQGYGFVQLGRSGCLPLTGVAISSTQFPFGMHQCVQFNEEVLQLLIHNPRVQIVVLAGRWSDAFPARNADARLVAAPIRKAGISAPESSAALFRQSLAASIEGLRKAGKQVILIDDVPNFDFDPKMRVISRFLPVREALAQWLGAASSQDSGFGSAGNSAVAAATSAQIRLALEGFRNVPRIDLKPAFCRTAEHCDYRSEDRLYYFDSQHLTADGATHALRDFVLPEPSPAE